MFTDCAVGTQEYSSRWAGVTWGIILAIMVPILLILVCVGYRLMKKRKEQEEMDAVENVRRIGILDTSKSRSPVNLTVIKNTEDFDNDSLPYKRPISEIE